METLNTQTHTYSARYSAHAGPISTDFAFNKDYVCAACRHYAKDHAKSCQAMMVAFGNEKSIYFLSCKCGRQQQEIVGKHTDTDPRPSKNTNKKAKEGEKKRV